ncbi:translation initiation factor [Cyanobium sp. T1B-Tous]|uniref:translation initiation factor n=1 Tax=Cyanobium sp. T1B-Tous TaxID=2823721 RepID=UPI0020CBA9DD|nr:translation initiation factor [Cyanobium sp. T1B-Tous]MCP9807575.1 translation initiation factor [Cyanobium sp. T1B-Tous]
MAKKGGWQEFSSNSASTARPTATGSGPAGAPSSKAQQRVRVQRTKAGKGGKLVTAITGLEAPEAELKTLLKQLKAVAGAGGTVKDGVNEEEQLRQVGLMGERKWAPSIQFTDARKRSDSANCMWC